MSEPGVFAVGLVACASHCADASGVEESGRCVSLVAHVPTLCARSAAGPGTPVECSVAPCAAASVRAVRR